MKKTIHLGKDRGSADHGWLKSRFSFSFANYHDPNKMGFGTLRVINDDFIAPNNGFGMHPHSNMEIISIVTKGQLDHQDSLGSKTIISPGMVQVMSAGSGILHSEKNPSETDETHLYQIWIQTDKANHEPRHAEEKYDYEAKNVIQTVVSGNQKDPLWIHQNAKLSIGNFENHKEEYTPIPNNGVYCLVMEGTFTIEGQELNKNDAMGIEEAEQFQIQGTGKILLIDVPM